MKPAQKLLSAVSAVALALTPAVGGGLALNLISAKAAQAAVVSSISVRGNKRVSAATISDFVGFKAGKNYSAADVDDAVKRLFATGLVLRRQCLCLRVDACRFRFGTVHRQPGHLPRQPQAERRQPAFRSSGLQPRGAFDQATLDGDVQAIVDSYSAASVGNDVTVNAERRRSRRKPRQRCLRYPGRRPHQDFADQLRRQQRVQRSSPAERHHDEAFKPAFVADAQGRLSTISVWQPTKSSLRRFYFNRGYADFRILSSSGDVDPNTGNIMVTIEVDEGERYTFGNVEIDSTVSGVTADDLRSTDVDPQWRYGLQCRRGRGYADRRCPSASQAAGFPFAEVTPVGNRNFEISAPSTFPTWSTRASAPSSSVLKSSAMHGHATM